MRITINTIDYTGQISGLNVEQNTTSQVNNASFSYLKAGDRTYIPQVMDEVKIYDDTDHIFNGKIIKITETTFGVDGINYKISCASDAFDLESILVAESFANKSVKEIIEYIIDEYAPSFTYANVQGSFIVQSIVFNQITIADCLRRLAKILTYEWFVDVDKDIHFIPKYTEVAPFNLTDTSGNYIFKSLKRQLDGTQIVNRVVVRGGEYDGASFGDVITVKGDDTTTFNLPYRFSNLTVSLNGTPQTIGIENIDDFTTADVLYNFTEKLIRFETELSDGDLIAYTGNPKIPVLAIGADSASELEFGLRERVIRDDSISDLTTARKRAISELDTYSNEAQDLSFATYTRGLRAGMVINVSSELRGLDKIFFIKRLTFKPVDKDNFVYNVELVSTKKMELIDVLQKLLKTSKVKADPNETAETIEVDNTDITITELITAISAVSDIIDVSITELIEDDPLGEGVEPTWVLAPYFPTGIDDPKRAGLLDRSFKLY